MRPYHESGGPDPRGALGSMPISNGKEVMNHFMVVFEVQLTPHI